MSYSKFIKKIIYVLGVVTCILLGQTYDLSFSNQHVSGSDFIFDIYMLNTGAEDLYLSDCDLVLTFNSQYFSTPAYQVVSSGISTFYTLSSSVISIKRTVLNIKRPTFSSQTEFDSRTTLISKVGNGTLISTMKISGISNTSGTAGMQWRTSGLNRNSCTFLDNSDPWLALNRSANATFNPGSDASLPVELVSFSAEFKKGKIQINWKTASEINNIGFELYRSTIEDSIFEKIASYSDNDDLKSRGQSSHSAEYYFIDKEIVLGQSYSYKLVDISLSGEVKEHDPINIELTLSEGNMHSLSSVIPKHYDLHQNYPNPFNSTTNIRFDIPLSG